MANNSSAEKQSASKELVFPVIVLVVICLVCSAILAVLNNITAPIIEANSRAETLAAYVSVLPQGTTTDELTELENQYPEILNEETDANGDVQKFPSFEGKDLDGNEVKSDELFSANAVTVVNFWFTTCNPCVGELSELDALNKELAEKGGSLIGVNTFTLDGDEAAISEAKDLLAKKGATYQNVYFDSDGEAGKFTINIFAYPTTYVVDRSGNIVGEPIVGAITEKKQAETLQKLIEQALAADVG